MKEPPPPPNLREVTMITQLGEGINYVHEREEITVFVLPASGFSHGRERLRQR